MGLLNSQSLSDQQAVKLPRARRKLVLPTMEANQETSEVTNSTAYELNLGEKEVNPSVAVETDVSESSSNAIVTAAAVFARPLAKQGYAIGTSSSSSRVREVRQPPPFLQKVYDMVRKPETDSIISWNSTGTSFIVWDPHKFAAEVLGKYFRHNNFSSFVCQLNTYGFKKINWDRLEFQNEWFQKGKKSWLKKIKRRSTQNVQQTRVIESAEELTLPEKQKKLENLVHEHDALKDEMMKLKELHEDLQNEMTTLEQQAQCILSKRQKVLQYMVQEFLMRKKDLQSTRAAREHRSDGQQSIESSVELLDEGETSHGRKEKSPSKQSDTKKACSDVDLGAGIQEKEKCTIVEATFPDFHAADYALLEKQLMDDLNSENVSEEERIKQSNVVIALEDLLAGPSDWTEYAKVLGHKARNKC